MATMVGLSLARPAAIGSVSRADERNRRVAVAGGKGLRVKSAGVALSQSSQGRFAAAQLRVGGEKRMKARVCATRCAVIEPAVTDNNGPETTWRRVVTGTEQKAQEIWSSVHNSAAAAAKGAWAGVQPAHRVLLSDIIASPKRNAFLRKWLPTDFTYASFIGILHVGCLLAPFTFTWSAFYCFLTTYFITGCLGITLSYHRQLSHKSFQTPKWLEYALAYCGALAVQGDPLEWASSHRHHHQHCDTPKDPHTPYEGFWWSHMGWLLDNEATLERVGDRSNAQEMAAQPFYRFMEKTYIWHVIGSAVLLFALGGLPWLVWGFCLRTVWVYHITWAVNSVAHVWGSQEYNTGDLSRNNWPVGILAFGEGWHNNHHAFEFSARHGLKWWQVDMTWYTICALKFLGLANKVKLPKQAQMDKMRFSSGATA